jgi:uncharacterized protein (TIGR02284 family)
MGSSSKVISALNALIESNDRRFHHYNALADKSTDDRLKHLFQGYANRSVDFTSSLTKWRSAYGGSTYVEKKFNGFSFTGKLRDVFMAPDKNDILNQCETIEIDTLKLYKTALVLSFLPSEAIVDIQQQIVEFEKVRVSLNTLKKR